MTAFFLQRDIDRLVDRLKRLVIQRSMLESYGASAAKFSTISEEIACVREQLARRARRLATVRNFSNGEHDRNPTRRMPG